jgi:hypothetical protein
MYSMRAMIGAALVCAVSLVVLLPLPASAAPPASCAKKFVGTWSITVLATGQTYTSRIRADGTLSSACPLCPASQTWTCNGNTFILTSPVTHTHTISADGRRMTGGCCTARRIGGGAVAAAKPGRQQAAAQPSREWQSCLNGPAEPGIAACSTLIRTRRSGAKKLNSDDIGWAYGTRAFHYASQGDYARAMPDVEESIRLREPKNLTFAHFVRGYIYQNQADHRRAIADFSKAVETNPKFGVAFAARGKSHLLLNEVERGNADYESAVQASPDSRFRFETERDWILYLKEIQDAGDYENWSAPPIDALRASGR